MIDTGPWFTVRAGAQYNGNMILLPMTFVGPETLTGAGVNASGEHVVDVSTQGAFFGEVAELGDLVRGDECSIVIRTDGTPGPFSLTLDVEAADGVARRLVIDVPERGGMPLVAEHPA